MSADSPEEVCLSIQAMEKVYGGGCINPCPECGSWRVRVWFRRDFTEYRMACPCGWEEVRPMDMQEEVEEAHRMREYNRTLILGAADTVDRIIAEAVNGA